MVRVELNDLPEFPVVQELSRALWRAGDLRGAAVMVGAGFSRNADRPGPTSKQSPSWDRLVRAMSEALGHHACDTTDALEVAQQYEAVFGRQSLDGLIRDWVPDLALQPGPLHRHLLRLRWSEVLTTNYDTLLERCAEQSPSQTFEVVRSQSDIPRTRSPRIVKLHGTLPSGPFVIASEDYRDYPRRHAAMVNLVQQVLLENHLVLLGFSATDPNFLAWTGWVRDNLGEAARRLILVGLFDISAGARRVLDSRGVTVVDLSPLVAGEDAEDRHGFALERFLTALEKAKPPHPGAWELQSPPPDMQAPIPGVEAEGATGPQHWFSAESASHRLQARIPAWIADRESYPGWIIAPYHSRLYLKHSLSSDQPHLAAAIRALSEEDRARAVFELAWRYDVALQGLPIWLCEEIEELLKSERANVLTGRERFQAALFSLTAAREARNASRFEAIRSWIRSHPIQEPDLLATAAYEEALWARDGLELERLADLIERIGGRDPIFHLRRAALWCELGAFEQAHALITHALADLRQRRARDRHSVWVLSRYGWALYLAWQISESYFIRQSRPPDRPAEENDELWPANELGEAFCDPRQELRDLDQQLSEAEREAAERRIIRRPGFDAGAFTYHRYDTDTGTPTTSVVGDLVSRLALRVGMPARFNEMDINRTRIDRVLAITNPILDAHLLSLCALINWTKGGVIDRFLNRVSVANLTPDLVRNVLARALAGIDVLLPFLGKQTSGAAKRSDRFLQERVSVLLEIASRLVIRLPAGEAADVLKRGLAWARDPRWQHNWTSKFLGHLLSRAIEAFSAPERATILLDMANHPLPGEKEFSYVAAYWPEPWREFELPAATPRPTTPMFAARIERLTEEARAGSELDRERALLRLHRLFEAEVLTAEEVERFAAALWERVGTDGLPTDTTFRRFAFLKLPQRFPGQAEVALRSAFLPTADEIQVTEALLDLLGSERPQHEPAGPYFQLTPGEAVRCLDAILAMRLSPHRQQDGSSSDRNQTSALLGAALAVGILPTLDGHSVGPDRLARLSALIQSGDAPSTVHAWPQVVRLAPVFHDQAVEGITKALLSGGNECVHGALWAVERWRVMVRSGELGSLPPALLRALISLVATRRIIGLIGALRIAANCYRDGIIDNQDVQLVLAGLDALVEETTSIELALEDDAAALRVGTLTLIRREAARSALVLKAAGVQSPIVERWAQLIPDDPFPEVRSLLTEQIL